MGNFDPKMISREVDMAPVYGVSVDRGSNYAASMLQAVQGCQQTLKQLSSGVDQIIAQEAGNPAIFVGSIAGPYNTSTNDEGVFSVSGAGNITVNVTQNAALSTTDMAASLNGDSSFSAVMEAFVTADDVLAIRGKGTSITSDIDLVASGTAWYAAVGGDFVAGTTVKSDAMQWDEARTSLIAEIDSAMPFARTLTKLANSSAGNTPKEDLTA